MSATYTADMITEATRRLDIVMSRLMVAFSRAVGISVPEMLALEHLDADGSLGPSELARRLQMTTGAVTVKDGYFYAIAVPDPVYVRLGGWPSKDDKSVSTSLRARVSPV